MKQIQSWLTALLLVACTVNAAAATNIAKEALAMEYFGQVELIRSKQMEIVISDKLYKLSLGTVIKSSSGNRISLGYIKPGSKVAYAVDKPKNRFSDPVVTEIWLLPGSFKLPQPE